MHSPPIEWALFAGYFAALDVIRDRGEPDGDTATEVIRTTFAVDTPAGKAAFTAALAASALLFHRHICKPIGGAA